MEHVELKTIRYNHARHAFEARVDLTRDGIVFRYPCEVSGPREMDEALVRDALKAHALRMSDSLTRH